MAMKKYIAYVVQSIADHKKSLKIVLGLFLIGFFMGCLDNETVSASIYNSIKALIDQFKNLHGIDLFMRIFLHNFMAAALATASGLLFGIFPLISAFLNGLVIGTVLTHLSAYTDLAFIQAVLSIIPHGIFEIPAFLLALAMGLTLGMWPFKEEKVAFLKRTFNTVSSMFFKVIIPFLVIAAAIETIGIELLR
ncbi:MAG: stage II sporulation protein M [Desulfobacteraceae bacterium]|nr:MAG: stage II sporulation protein M [Desulfobacteraceae bacterium]